MIVHIRKMIRRIQVLPSGLWITAIVIASVGGRYLWICVNRPEHLQEIVAAYGSVSVFEEDLPRSDSAGRRITFVKTAESGFGLYLCDTVTGQKRNVQISASQPKGAYTNLRVWPWSPDDRFFVYSDAERILICNPETGKSTAEINAPTVIVALTWLTPTAFLCVDRDGNLYRYQREPDGTWARIVAAEHPGARLVQRSVGKSFIVSASDTLREAEADNESEVTGWRFGKTSQPVWLQYEFRGSAWAITQYKLISSPEAGADDPRDWQLLGSDDGSHWTVLDNRTNQVFTSRLQTRQYTFSNRNPYWCYRLNITGTAGDPSGGVRLAEFQLWSEDTPDVASASDENLPVEPAAAAFDGLTNTKWFSRSSDSATWLQLFFGGGRAWTLTEYALTSGNDVPNRDPLDWQFQASNDGIAWTNLDVRTGEAFESRLQTRSYSFTNSTPYRAYRLNITANHGNAGDGLQLSEVDLGLKKLLEKFDDPTARLVQRSPGQNVTASASDTPSRVEGNNESEGMAWKFGKTSQPVWLQYEFSGSAWASTQDKLISAPEAGADDPRDWQLLGSDDGSHWTVLDNRTNQVFTSRLKTKQYTFANRNPYRRYRLNITGTAGGPGSGVRLAAFQLWSEDTADVASASAECAPDETAANAFDGLTSTKWRTPSQTGWLQYEFGGGGALAVSGYALASGNDAPGRDPQSWQFQASNNGIAWTNLDVRAGEIFASRLQTKSYSFPNSTPYRVYRLNITTHRGNDSEDLQLSEFYLRLRKMPPHAPDNGLNDMTDARLTNIRLGLRQGLNPLARAICLTTISSNQIAWGQNNCIWIMDLTSNVPRLLSDIQTLLPAKINLSSFSYSKQTGRFLLSCSQDGKDSVWCFDADDPASGLRQISTAVSVRAGAWITDTTSGGWVGRKDNMLLTQNDSGSRSVRTVPFDNIDGFIVSPDGRHLFINGIADKEAASGIWQYDLASAKLHCVVPASEHPSPYAKREVRSHHSIQLPSGKTVAFDIFSPANLDRQSNGKFLHHNKYPMVIGNSVFGGGMLGGHGWLWVPAMTAGNAYVVVVKRENWLEGIEQWGDNVTAVYNHVTDTLPIDKNQVFLFGASAETAYLGELMAKSPELWKGAILLNPGGYLISPTRQRTN